MPIPEGVRGRIINNDTMKKLLYCMLAVLFLTACSGNTPTQSTTKGDYVDLGLQSGTKWKTQNEQNDYYDLFDYETAVYEFGSNLPTKEQWEEVNVYCHWEWTGSGYKVTGPNGKSITLPAAGYRSCRGNVVHGVGTYGDYWSSTLGGLELAWSLYFYSGMVSVEEAGRCRGRSVRLVR